MKERPIKYFKLCLMLFVLFSVHVQALIVGTNSAISHVSPNKADMTFIKDLVRLSGERTHKIISDMVSIDGYLKDINNEDESINIIMGLLNRIETIHKRLLNDEYLKEDILNLKNTTAAISLVLNKVRENNLWGHKDNLKIELRLNDVAGVWKGAATMQKIIAVIMGKVVK